MTPPTRQSPNPLGDERIVILQMVQDGTITPDEGARLLEAMDRKERSATPPAPPAPPAAKTIRIRITNEAGDHDVDLDLPLGLVEFGLNMANRVAPGKVPDFSEIRKTIRDGYTGTLIKTQSGKDLVEITINEK